MPVFFHVTHHVNLTCDRDSAANVPLAAACPLTRSCYMLKACKEEEEG